ncbi:MAG: glycosyltransferase [Muribaculaceae bacterium]
MFLPFTISPIQLLLLGLSLIFTIFLLSWYFTCFRALPRYRKSLRNDEIDYSNEQPAVSIIVYASNEEENIINNLPIILSQEYPKYEVIVVNDSSTDNSADVLSAMEAQYENLYQTFVPIDTRNLSRKKLSLTLGIKAAKYDIILTTTANCQPQSNQWLALMMRNFNDYTDVVIGYSHKDYNADRSGGKWFRSYDTVMSASLYLSYAQRAKPYRGDGNNLAYRKHLFFDNKGFSNSLNLHFGDDDLFINQVATRYNTRIELSADSQIIAKYDDIASTHHELKMRYDFTARYLNTSAKIMASMASMSFLGLTLSCAAIVALGITNIITISIASLLWIGTVIAQIIIFRANASVLQAPRLLFCIPFYAIMRPFINFRYKLQERSTRKCNYTWQRRQ